MMRSKILQFQTPAGYFLKVTSGSMKKTPQGSINFKNFY